MRDLHSTVTLAPAVGRRILDPVLAAQLCYPDPRLVLVQYCDDLLMIEANIV